MYNKTQRGHIVNVVLAAVAVSGQPFLFGTSLFGVAMNDGAIGDTVPLDTEGVFDLPKATGALTVGQKIYWDNTAGNVTGTATSNTRVGVCVAAAASGDATASVKIGPGALI